MLAIANTPAPAVCLDYRQLEEMPPAEPMRGETAAWAADAAASAASFDSELQELNLRNARLGAWIVMVLVPLCAVLDWLTYPQLFWQFLVLRLACAAACVPLLLALRGDSARRCHWLYPITLPMLPAATICAMIYLSGDAGSPYYAGLCLCLAGTSFVFHWTFREIGLTIGLIMACYLAATVPNLDSNGDLRSTGLFVNNTFFLILTCLILYLGSRQHHATRLREFHSRCEVEAQREELRQRNEDLTSALRRLRETEAQLTQSEKLASIGRLSAGIIHEINNPLNFVKMAIFVLKEKAKAMPPELADPVTAIVADIDEGVGRVGSIVSDLRGFAHPETRTQHPVDVRQAVAKALRLLAKEIDDQDVRLNCDVAAGIIVLGDENQISQIVLNLVQNSLDALAGCLTPAIEICATCAGGGVELCVRDSGAGIAAADLQRIFDPFFTTKEVGQGMGLGLSLCYRMMQQMNGCIEVHSTPGHVTEFRLRFRQPPMSVGMPEGSATGAKRRQRDRRTVQ